MCVLELLSRLFQCSLESIVRLVHVKLELARLLVVELFGCAHLVQSNQPLDDLALVPGDLGRNVVLDDLRQGVTVGNLLHPLRQLAVPQQGVAANQLAVALGPVDDLVSVAEVELASRGYDVLAFPPKEPPRQGHSRSIASHFMLFSHVTWPNCALAMFITPVLLRW